MESTHRTIDDIQTRKGLVKAVTKAIRALVTDGDILLIDPEKIVKENDIRQFIPEQDAKKFNSNRIITLEDCILKFGRIEYNDGFIVVEIKGNSLNCFYTSHAEKELSLTKRGDVYYDAMEQKKAQ